MDLSKNKIDSVKETEGVWCDFDNETSFLLARYENPAHKELMRKKIKPYRRQFRNNTASDDLVQKLEVECIAESIVLGWTGLMNGDKEIKYSVKTANEILSNPQYVELLEFVKEQANDLANFYVDIVEEGIENIKKLSNGN